MDVLEHTTIETSFMDIHILTSVFGKIHKDDKDSIQVKYWNMSFSIF
jgi:hypothetical protein